jgi:RNA recognition motif-containing protein
MRIFVGNLPYKMSERELRDSLAEHVEIVHFDLKRDAREGRAQGFGWIVVADDDAPTAIEKLNGLVVGGRKLRAELAISAGRRYGASPPSA